MRKKIPHSWERMDGNTHRCRVIGGWLVIHVSYDLKTLRVLSESMSFVLDRDHEWTLVPPIENLDPVK